VFARAEKRKGVMSMRKRVTQPPPKMGARLDVVLRAGINAAPIGAACPADIIRINNELGVMSITDEEIVEKLENVKRSKCGGDPSWPSFLMKLHQLRNRPKVQLWAQHQLRWMGVLQQLNSRPKVQHQLR